MIKKDDSLIQRLPGALERLGSKTFVEMEAGQLEADQAQIVFFWPGLLQNDAGKDLSPAETLEFVANNLLLTLDQDKMSTAAKKIRVFVDRQADPMNMSLNGNLGSGRAVYYGSCFNLKGIGKTVLATSTDRNHSNGHLDLVSALWEAICANVISTNLETGSAPVLAVVDSMQDIEVPWREGKYPGGFIIRIDHNGELDRPTHLFYREEPLSALALHQFACDLARQDAEKFIEQILHGCWSAGNISLRGHMIDYDTVFALRSRAPQWSYRPNWQSNFFGLEGEGQKKLLKAVFKLAQKDIKLSLKQLYKTFSQARRQQLQKRFLDLVGIGSNIPLTKLSVADEQYCRLVDLFVELSMKMFPDFRATAPWSEDNSRLQLFDFARYFRFCPLLIEQNLFNENTALKLLINSQNINKETKVEGMPESIERVMREKFVVSTPEQMLQSEKKAKEFIALYSSVMQKIRNDNVELWHGVIVRSYLVNEERTYMNCRPGNDTLVALVQNYKANRLSAQALCQRVQILIMACDRRAQERFLGCCLGDVRVFIDGFRANLISKSSYFRPLLALFAESELFAAPAESWQIQINEQKSGCLCTHEGEMFFVIGPEIELSQLLDFADKKVAFLYQGKEFRLSPIERLTQD